MSLNFSYRLDLYASPSAGRRGRRIEMRRLLLMGLLSALAGCGGGEDTGNNGAVPVAKPTPRPMLGGVDLNQQVQASGSGPYWEIHVAPGTITYADAPDAAHPTDFYPVSPKLAGGRAVFDTKTPEAAPVTITLTATPCAAGKDARPLTAEVQIGARTLRGCAGPAPRVVRPAAETGESNMTEAQ
ncbi:hypothetical protein E5A73_00065 [Sphingomonas gei]|uniref:Uncharacterized protein n=1 Tax=Sphingomonas gei TaxID=1395960 RepID=A0A4S1XIE0_9SPHN|nr:hypothetical protein [Sphingomonas gei]TGX55573.1 hypothetical protein E5A73_00065 [Sphingomonas gei]